MYTKVVKVLSEICSWLMLVYTPVAIALFGLVSYIEFSSDGPRWLVVGSAMMAIIFALWLGLSAVGRVRKHQPAALAKNIFLVVWTGGVLVSFCMKQLTLAFWWRLDGWLDFWYFAEKLCVIIETIAVLLFVVVIVALYLVWLWQKKADEKAKEISGTSRSDC